MTEFYDEYSGDYYKDEYNISIINETNNIFNITESNDNGDDIYYLLSVLFLLFIFYTCCRSYFSCIICYKVRQNNKILNSQLEERKNINENCPICFDIIDNGVSLNCDISHVFHRKCILGWLEVNQSCPICRAKILTKNNASNKNEINELNYNESQNSDYLNEII